MSAKAVFRDRISESGTGIVEWRFVVLTPKSVGQIMTLFCNRRDMEVLSLDARVIDRKEQKYYLTIRVEGSRDLCDDLARAGKLET